MEHIRYQTQFLQQGESEVTNKLKSVIWTRNLQDEQNQYKIDITRSLCVLIIHWWMIEVWLV